MVKNMFAEPMQPRSSWKSSDWGYSGGYLNEGKGADPWSKGGDPWSSGKGSDPWSSYGKGKGGSSKGKESEGGWQPSRKGIFVKKDEMLDLRHPSKLDTPFDDDSCELIAMMMSKERGARIEEKIHLQQLRPIWVRCNKNWRKSALYCDHLSDLLSLDFNDEQICELIAGIECVVKKLNMRPENLDTFLNGGVSKNLADQFEGAGDGDMYQCLAEAISKQTTEKAKQWCRATSPFSGGESGGGKGNRPAHFPMSPMPDVPLITEPVGETRERSDVPTGDTPSGKKQKPGQGGA